MSDPENENIQEFNRFLQNNADLLQEKYRQYFTLNQVPIESVDPNNIVRFISDIFSFNRYHDPATTSKISKSLTQNFQAFLKQNKQIKVFDAAVAIQVLKYSIQNNQLFAVKYQTNAKEESPGNNEKGKSKRLIGQLLEQQKNHSKERIENQQNGNQTPKSENNRSMLFKNSFEFGDNEFDEHEHIKVIVDPMLVQKNSRILFNFYCKQQMQLAKNLSFQRLEKQSQTLSMTNMLLMAQLMNFYSSTLTKQVIISKFRKVSDGKKDIVYQKFDILLSQLQIIDPTLAARTELNLPNMHKKLKSKKKPFNTQDSAPRQLVRNRPFKKKLTMHSGRMQADLVEDIREIKNQKKEPTWKTKLYEESIFKKESSRYRMENISRISPNVQQEMLSAKKLLQSKRNLSSDLKAMSKIVKSQDDDDKWLGQYQIKPSQNLPPKQKQRSFEEINVRKGTIVQNIKKRIKQLERQDREQEYQTRAVPYMSNIKKSNISSKK